jgi:hypothetical protein
MLWVYPLHFDQLFGHSCLVVFLLVFHLALSIIPLLGHFWDYLTLRAALSLPTAHWYFMPFVRRVKFSIYLYPLGQSFNLNNARGAALFCNGSCIYNLHSARVSPADGFICRYRI